jgi:hypothetical protein
MQGVEIFCFFHLLSNRHFSAQYAITEKNNQESDFNQNSQMRGYPYAVIIYRSLLKTGRI